MTKYLFLLVSLFFTAGCVDKPEITIKDIRIEGISQGQIKMKVLLDIQNTNAFSITLRKIDYKMFHDTSVFGTGSWEGREEIDGGASKIIPVSLVADRELITRVFLSYFGGQSGSNLSKISLEGKAVIQKYGISYSKVFKWKYKDKDRAKNKEIREAREHDMPRELGAEIH